MQKIKSLVNRRHSQKVPEAPVAPAPVVATVAPVAVAPITSDALLAQKESLSNSSELYRDKNVYNNLVQDAEFGAGRQRLSRGYEAEVLSTGLAGQRLSQTYENTLLNETAYVQGERRASLVRAAPTVLETIEKEVVIQERIHPVEKEEIQPIIYREREQLDVKQVTQMLHETQIEPTIIQQRELPAERREAIIERGAAIEENIILPSVHRDATLRTQQIHAPIVEETIKRTVIEEIQPVLERDVFVPTVIQNTQPIYEKIVEAPTVYREVRDMRVQSTEFVQPALYTQPALPVYTQPAVRETIVVPSAPKIEYVTMATTTTTNETFVPAKLIQEGELRNWQPAASQVAQAPIRRV